MSKPKAEDKERVAALSELRREKWKAVFNDNIRVWKSIRDDPGAKDKDRIEAAKCLARQLDILSPEKVTQPPGGKSPDKWWDEDLSESDRNSIDNTIDSVKPN